MCTSCMILTIIEDNTIQYNNNRSLERVPKMRFVRYRLSFHGLLYDLILNVLKFLVNLSGLRSVL